MAPDAPRRPRGRIAGSVTLVALCLTTALSITLGSYLALCYRSAQFATRTLHQERARELAQVGLEEALWALNRNNWTSSGPASAAAWFGSGTDRSVMLTYPQPDGGTGTLVIAVTNFNSTGPVWPTIASAATLTLKNGEVFTKTLQATTAPMPLFGNAIASAESYVSFTAAGTVDSWNSDPDNDPATARVPYSFTAGNPSNYAAVVAGNDNGSYGVILTQATVYGYVATSGQPVSYATSGSPAGRVLGPATPAGVKVDTSRLGKSAFIPMDPVLTVTPPATSGPYYGGVLGSLLGLLNTLLGGPTGYTTYKMGGLTLDGSPISGLLGTPNPVINRPLKLIIDGDLTLRNFSLLLINTKGKITITPTGSLEIYVKGNVSIGGDGFDNQTGDPSKLAIFSLSSSGSGVTYDSAAAFCGVIYSEEKPIDIRRNGPFTGAVLGRNSVRFSNAATAPIFHYDTALRQKRFEQVSTSYIIKQITEL